MTDSSTLDAPIIEQHPTTHGAIEVGVRTRYIQDQSEPSDERYVFAYTITLTNHGQVPTQLISRHWIITDANDETQEVKGVGVVGQQPVLKPGESYTYTSGVIIATDTGTMTGSYQMRTLNSADEESDPVHDTFDAPIPVFGLVTPERLH